MALSGGRFARRRSFPISRARSRDRMRPCEILCPAGLCIPLAACRLCLHRVFHVKHVGRASWSFHGNVRTSRRPLSMATDTERRMAGRKSDCVVRQAYMTAQRDARTSRTGCEGSANGFRKFLRRRRRVRRSPLTVKISVAAGHGGRTLGIDERDALCRRNLQGRMRTGAFTGAKRLR